MASVEDAPQQDELCSTLDASNFLSPVNLKVYANPEVFLLYKMELKLRLRVMDFLI